MLSDQRCAHFSLIYLLLHLQMTVYVSFNLPIVLNTWQFENANEEAWRVISKEGRSALDALVAGCSACEEQQCDGTVGYGGSPDENGETTLDAMIIDGSNMNMGAVAGLREIKQASFVARLVLEHTQHSLLVGDAASKFAEMMGLQRQSLTTPQSKAMWQKWHENNCQPNFWLNVIPNAKENCGPYRPNSDILSKGLKRYEYNVNQSNHDTIGMIVIDSKGQIYAGTSTNGAKYKIPGRVGDSPLPGAGAYADNEVGAAVATGDGDIIMRFLPTFTAVEAMRMGTPPAVAAVMSIKRIVRHYSDFSGAIVVTDRFGNYSAACAGMPSFPFCVANANGKTEVKHVACI